MQTKVAICALAKNEDRYINEWVSYYLSLGVNHIYIYDNNDNETPVMKSLKSTNVSVIPLYGYESLKSHGFQRGIYLSCYKQFGHLYDWIGFFDIDEFFTLNQDKSLDAYFSRPSFNRADIIHVNWKYYGDNDLVLYDDRPVRERFKLPAPDGVRYAQTFPENNHVKSWVKTNRNFTEINAHTAWFANAMCVHTDGIVSDAHSCFHPYTWNVAQVNHYGTKTIDEYIQRRILHNNRVCGAAPINAEQRIRWFFNVNKHTEVKDKLVSFILSKVK